MYKSSSTPLNIVRFLPSILFYNPIQHYLLKETSILEIGFFRSNKQQCILPLFFSGLLHSTLQHLSCALPTLGAAVAVILSLPIVMVTKRQTGLCIFVISKDSGNCPRFVVAGLTAF
jgi:hypothetical protein